MNAYQAREEAEDTHVPIRQTDGVFVCPIKGRTDARSRTNTQVETRNEQKKRTSAEEYGVDAWAHKTEEGRGDRRNVQGELHTSDEP